MTSYKNTIEEKEIEIQRASYAEKREREAHLVKLKVVVWVLHAEQVKQLLALIHSTDFLHMTSSARKERK